MKYLERISAGCVLAWQQDEEYPIWSNTAADIGGLAVQSTEQQLTLQAKAERDAREMWEAYMDLPEGFVELETTADEMWIAYKLAMAEVSPPPTPAPTPETPKTRTYNPTYSYKTDSFTQVTIDSLVDPIPLDYL